MNYKIMKLKTLCFPILTILVLISAAYAADTSQVIPFSGNIAGQPDGDVALRLRLFPVATGGAFVFQETQTVIVSGEAFSVLIGNGTPAGIPSSTFLNPSLWIAFALESMPEAEIGDRMPITASGYAFKAINANAAQTAASAQTAESATRATSAQRAETLNPGASITGSLSGPILRITNTARTGPQGEGGQSRQDGEEAGPMSPIEGVHVSVNNALCGSASVVGANGGCGVGVRGTSVSGNGVQGISQSGYGVWGESQGFGVYGKASGTSGRGVWGYATSSTGTNFGVYGSSVSTSGIAVFGRASASTGLTNGVWGEAQSEQGRGVSGIALATTGETVGIYGESASSQGKGVIGKATGPGGTVGVWGESSYFEGSGVYGRGGNGVNGEAFSTRGWGVRGDATATSGNTIGVWGRSSSTGGTGVLAAATASVGLTYGVYGQSFSPQGYAGYFVGPVVVTGTLSKGGGSFKIDHPLDPANKYLYHSFVESPDMKNIYDGVALLDGDGQAVVQLPGWFESLNRDFRYQLTAIGAPGPDLYIAEEISGNRFKIAGGQSGSKVSWQVTGIRKDAFAEKYRIPIEEEKPANEQGYYLHPDAYNQPKTKSIEWARNPELMKQLQEEQANRSNH